MERAELPVQRNRTLKCRGVTSFSSAEQAGGIQPLTSISRKHASSSYYSLLALISVALQSRDNLVSLPAAIGALSEKHHYTGMNPVPQAAKARRRSSPSCTNVAGSSNGQWSRAGAPENTGHSSRARLQTVITNSNSRPANSASGFERWPEISMPSSRMTSTASLRTCVGCVPAEYTSNHLSASCRSSPSAI